MKDLIIIGNGGFAKEIACLIEDMNSEREIWNILGFISSDEEDIGSRHGKYEIVGCDKDIIESDKEINIAIGLGSPEIIDNIVKAYRENKNLVFPNLIHPTVIYDHEGVKFGKGNILCAGTIFTTDIIVGSFNMFNLSCTIGHDTRIGDCNVFNPSANISGNVTVEDRILVGTGAQVLQNINICSDVIVGAGAVATKDINDPGVYVGTPARKLK